MKYRIVMIIRWILNVIIILGVFILLIILGSYLGLWLDGDEHLVRTIEGNKRAADLLTQIRRLQEDLAKLERKIRFEDRALEVDFIKENDWLQEIYLKRKLQEQLKARDITCEIIELKEELESMMDSEEQSLL